MNRSSKALGAALVVALAATIAGGGSDATVGATSGSTCPALPQGSEDRELGSG